MQILYENKQINNTYNTKFLRLIIESSLSWNVHIDELTAKLNKACYAMRLVKPSMFSEVWMMIYFSYVYSITSYGIILGGGILLMAKLYSNSKRITRIIMGSSSTYFCHGLIKNLKVLPLQFQYIFSYLLLRIENCLDLILMYRTLIKDVILTYIYPYQI